MSQRLRFSPAFSEQMRRVHVRIFPPTEAREEHWWQTLRIALARSIQEISLSRSPLVLPQLEQVNGKPFEIELFRIEQGDGLLFRAMLQQLHQKRFSDEEYEDFVQKHIEHGLNIADQETERNKGFEYLLAIAKKGVRNAPKVDTLEKTSEMNSKGVNGFGNIINLLVGLRVNGTEYSISFNKTSEHSNNHVAIIGKPGSGKTTFIKHFITELRKQSNFRTQFIMFDYKGDLWNAFGFHNDTRADVVSVHKQPIPLNMFTLEENSEQERRRLAERFVQIVRDVEANIGKIQEQKLYDAVLAAYNRAQNEGGTYPDFTDIRAELERIDKKPDSLTSVFRPLTEHNLFAEKEQPLWDSLLNRSVIFDIHALPAKKELCVFFILKELQRQIMLLPDSAVHPETSARTMRTVIVIDEAHHFLNDKKRVKILAEMIREVRSKGVAVMLLSQSPDDFDKADFDFLEMLEFVYVLNCNAASHKFLEQVFGISAQEARTLKQEVAALPVGTAFAKTSEGVQKINLAKASSR